MSLKSPSLRGRLYAGAAVALCVFTFSAQAQNRPTKFSVAPAQLQAIGTQTVPLQSQAESVRVSYPAQVVLPPNAEQVISSTVTGLITQLLVLPNQVVRVGTPLIRIASSELGQLQLQLIQANARATLARQAAQREQDLFAEGLIAQRRVQEARAALQDSEASLTQAKTALRLSGMPMATIDKVANSGIPLDSLVLVATQAGVVTEISVKPGQRVDSFMPLMHLAQTGTLWLEIPVPVTESNRWTPGSQLKVLGRDVTAQVLSNSATVSSGSQMVVMSALVQGKAGQVRPGELLTVELPIAATAGGWNIALSAVAHDGDQAYVFVRTQDGFEARPVKILASAGQRVRIQGPLKAGEEIAVSSVVALKGAWLNETGSQ